MRKKSALGAIVAAVVALLPMSGAVATPPAEGGWLTSLVS